MPCGIGCPRGRIFSKIKCNLEFSDFDKRSIPLAHIFIYLFFFGKKKKKKKGFENDLVSAHFFEFVPKR